MSERELTNEQRLAIGALKRSIKRTLSAGLIIVMQDGSVTIHFKDDYEADGAEMDCGVYGLKDVDGRYIDPIASFGGVEH